MKLEGELMKLDEAVWTAETADALNRALDELIKIEVAYEPDIATFKHGPAFKALNEAIGNLLDNLDQLEAERVARAYLDASHAARLVVEGLRRLGK